MLSTLSENWWAVTLRGVAAVHFGILAVLLPSIALTALIYVFGAYALVDGVFAFIAGLRGSGLGGCS